MNSTSRRSSTDRDRAVARLRAITLGTGLAGVAAVGGFGALAAASYDGTSTEGITTAALTTTTSDDSAATTDTSASISSTTDDSSSSSLSTTTAPTTTTTGTAHASTGSS